MLSSAGDLDGTCDPDGRWVHHPRKDERNHVLLGRQQCQQLGRILGATSAGHARRQRREDPDLSSRSGVHQSGPFNDNVDHNCERMGQLQLCDGDRLRHIGHRDDPT